MTITSNVYNFFSGLGSRFKQKTHAEQGLIAGGLTGAIYVAIRAAFSEISIPLIGEDISLQVSARCIAGLLTGRYYGNSIGNRLGETIDIWRNAGSQPDLSQVNESINNRIFLSKILPFLFAGFADFAVAYWKDYGGKPIFDFINLSSAEIYIFATLYGAYVGATIATREGRFFDFLSDEKLFIDFGVTRLIAFIKSKCSCSAALPPTRQTETITDTNEQTRLLNSV
ncbi:MAG: hypothetical protein K0S08_1046 [Gammaproteobacteria bacterium]|jgi:hypothetical protein|nr:hypothetical protein [Gammaproteobacteria bacterium]